MTLWAFPKIRHSPLTTVQLQIRDECDLFKTKEQKQTICGLKTYSQPDHTDQTKWAVILDVFCRLRFASLHSML